MRAVKTSLDDLRREIDDIDTSLHDLLMRRTELVREIGAAKGDHEIYIRPGREARILRRLVARHRGAFPKPVLVRIWREIISVFAALQGRLAIAVYAPEGGPDLRTRARDHFGSLTPITGHSSAMGVVRAVTENHATLGVLPVPESDDKDPWWRLLASDSEGTPRIIARVPFVSMEPALADGVEGLAIALAPQEDSGGDRSYLVVELPEPLSRDALSDQLTAAGFEVRDIKHWELPSDQPLHLVEIEGFVAQDDGRLATLGETATNGLKYWAIGGYAVPLTARELAAGDGAGAD
jgi:chorismate mutase